MKVAVLGASGIIGQSLIVSVPSGIKAVFTRRGGSGLYQGLDLEWKPSLTWLDDQRPDVIINLTGENRPDMVEIDPEAFYALNTGVPATLARWADAHNSHLIQVSSQAVFDHNNHYGFQKDLADSAVKAFTNWTIVRPTFVLGIRPFPAIGRENPAERILAGRETHSVDNRYFAVSFAWDVAELLWRIAQEPEKYRGQEINAGNPERVSRYSLAKMLGANPEPVTQEWAEANWGIAPRPMDTSGAYAEAKYNYEIEDGTDCLHMDFTSRVDDDLMHRALEVAAFLKIHRTDAIKKLLTGFGPLHNAVTEDFNAFFKRACDCPHAPHEGQCRIFIDRVVGRTDGTLAAAISKHQCSCGSENWKTSKLLDWYRTTESYIWELTAYHCDPGFNYSGMCKGILETLKARRTFADLKVNMPGESATEQKIYKPFRVLCLGDGVGSLTIALKEGGLEPVYHDLAGSRTAAFAAARFEMRFAEPVECWMTSSFSSEGMPGGFDAVVSLDYLEHVVGVDSWIQAIYGALKPGGVFCVQNAFAIGSGPDGAMPMHLQCNDRFEKDFDPAMIAAGFKQLASQWYEKPV